MFSSTKHCTLATWCKLLKGFLTASYNHSVFLPRKLMFYILARQQQPAVMATGYIRSAKDL